ncbi:MAG: sulfatase-like hydrolase/transferase [Kiritimatiellaeota bacterium]|nr:sulfatase-like hydrolase/transferase [Kiritimatiellota bacterium]
MNTILIVLDTWRRDHSGAYGNPWIHTPNIDRFAAQGAVFENAYIGSYPTLPCRRDILTGRFEFPRRGWGGLDFDDLTLPAVLGAAAKTSYFITDVYHHWGRDAGSYWRDFTGFDLVRGQERDGFITDSDVEFGRRALDYPDHVRPDEPHRRNAIRLRRDEEDWFCAQVFRRAARWIEHHAGHDDFFLMIDSFDPHEPWDAPRHYIDLYADTDFAGKEYVVAPYAPVAGRLTEAELRRTQALYAAEVTLVDRWFGYFLDRVERLGLLDNTLIILTSDHGTHNGDHGRTGKNWVLWDEISHIPLIIRHPRSSRGRRLGQFVQPVDFFPTLCDAVGVVSPAGLHGRSLMPFLEDPDAPDPRGSVLFGEFGQAVYLCDGDYFLVQGVSAPEAPFFSYSIIKSKWASDDWGPFDGVRRRVGPKNARPNPERAGTYLYHLPDDPKQEHDIADSAPEQLRRMQELLADGLREIQAPAELFGRFGLA